MSVSLGIFEPSSDAPFEPPSGVEFPSVQQMCEFYNLPASLPAKQQMHIWSMSIASLDGVISTAEPNERGTSGLGHAQYLAKLRADYADLAKSEPLESEPLKRYERDIKSIAYGKRADWRLLQMGWAQADAVLGSGAILRDEPNVKWQPIDEDLVEYRKEIKQSDWRGPIHVVLTSSGDIDINHPMIVDSEVRVYLLTTSKGLDKITVRSKESGVDLKMLESEKHTYVVNLQKSENSEHIDMRDVVVYLADELNVKYLDVTAGGLVIGKLIECGLLNEIRLTLATQLLGQTNSTGDLRPTWFSGLAGFSRQSFAPPTFTMAGLRMLCSHLVNLRMLKSQ